MTCCGNYCLAFCVVTVLARFVFCITVCRACGLLLCNIYHCMTCCFEIFDVISLAGCACVPIITDCKAIAFAGNRCAFFMTCCINYKCSFCCFNILFVFNYEYFAFALFACAYIIFFAAGFCAGCFNAGNLCEFVAFSLYNSGGTVFKNLIAANRAYIVIFKTVCEMSYRCTINFLRSVYCMTAVCSRLACNKFAALCAEVCSCLCGNKNKAEFFKFIFCFAFECCCCCVVNLVALLVLNCLAVSALYIGKILIVLSFCCCFNELAVSAHLCIFIGFFVTSSVFHINCVNLAAIIACVLNELGLCAACFSYNFSFKVSAVDASLTAEIVSAFITEQLFPCCEFCNRHFCLFRSSNNRNSCCFSFVASGFAAFVCATPVDCAFLCASRHRGSRNIEFMTCCRNFNLNFLAAVAGAYIIAVNRACCRFGFIVILDFNCMIFSVYVFSECNGMVCVNYHSNRLAVKKSAVCSYVCIGNTYLSYSVFANFFTIIIVVVNICLRCFIVFCFLKNQMSFFIKHEVACVARGSIIVTIFICACIESH